MTWVAVAAVAVLIAASAIYFFGIRWRLMARHGRLQVPCDEVIRLSAGEHVVYYEDAERWRYSETPRVGDGFSVLVSEAEGGRRIDLESPPSPTPTKISGRNRIPYAHLRLPRAGSYRITAEIRAGASKPHVTFG